MAPGTKLSAGQGFLADAGNAWRHRLRFDFCATTPAGR